jgi:hypothetical protein
MTTMTTILMGWTSMFVTCWHVSMEATSKSRRGVGRRGGWQVLWQQCASCARHVTTFM